MSRLVIVAGPQAAGKSTVIAKLSSQPQNVAPFFGDQRASIIFPLQESRQIITHKHILLGAIFMTLEHEIEVVNCDLERMDLILQRNQNQFMYVDECNIFTIAHALAHGVTQVEKYWDEYVVRLARLNAVVVFLNVLPSISWDRRSRRYEQRLIYFPEDQREIILERYHSYLTKLHPLLLDVYSRLPFPKVIIDSSCSEDNVIEMVCEQITALTTHCP